jgi:cyclopropane-fatty-acyl-phospholipid synthase
LLEELLGPDIPIGVRLYDGSTLGDPESGSTLVIRDRNALNRLVFAPGELGFARAYVAGEIDIEGDIWPVLALRRRFDHRQITLGHVLRVVEELGVRNLRHLSAPPEEARLRGRRHTASRDAAAISHHYDVSNDFYRLVLGPTMTYSCAVFETPDTSLDDAQEAKYELICQKLGLRPGMRLLDVGCGWGGMVLHAARAHGVDAVGITVSQRQAELAEKRVAEAGLSGRVAIRLQDYREVDDGPYDAISSIGMFEHVGAARLDEYFADLHRLLVPRGRLMNHGITRPAGQRARFARTGFIERYVFPDGELHEVGAVVSAVQRAGFEVRHLEDLREHYALTLRRWVANLETDWDAAVAEVGQARARIWRLYMAGCAVAFEDGNTRVHQIVATRLDERGASGMSLRPDWGHRPAVR